MLTLWNTLTRCKEAFTPLDPERVRLYVCGPTVYDDAHIGNARPIIVFDLLFRLLRQLYGPHHVVYVRNLTDVDDKINARAAERKISIRTLTNETIARFHEDMRALGVLMQENVGEGEFLEPRATDFICRREPDSLDMITLIARLIARGHAYEAEGHVLFHVPSMPGYGGLARRSADDMLAGARVEVAPYKRDPMDFVLWKPSRHDREPGWDSPWGYGRPGWHIECSVMAASLLGETFDIHGGGLDLIFPHHENEIAQSCCAFGTPFLAQVFLHNGFLQVEGQKMSKSLGNFRTIREVSKDWSGDVIRLAMMKTHYRQPIDWTMQALKESASVLESWQSTLQEDISQESLFTSGVVDALCDDLNTPQALVQLHKLAQEGKSQEGKKTALARNLRAFGFATRKTPNILALPISREVLDSQIMERLKARAAKNWPESDRIRDDLKAKGILLKDNKDGTTDWEIVAV
jgi:cysteinyl-tRNA synthetase